jgi:DNA-binding IclR family transcriptional regulator
MGEYCELLIIVKTILNRQVKHRRTSLSALAKAIEISRTTLYRRLVRLTEMGVVEHHGHEFVLAPGLICTPDAIRSVERIAAEVEDSTKKLSNLER